MKGFIIGMLTFMMVVPLLAEQECSDVEIIKDVIQSAYVDGLQNEGDFEKIDAGFHPDFELLGIGEGNEMWRLSISDWKKKIQEKLEKGELPRKEGEKISIKFLNVDVTGTVAVAKFEFYVGEKLAYIDYQSLYKFADGWKIVSKVFQKM